jgi:ribonuclease D
MFPITMPQPTQAEPDPQLIANAPDLSQFVGRLERERRIAFDTEAASFHRYADRIYLIQVSSDTETALIDPLAVSDLAPLGRLLAQDDLEVVFHDADYDLRALDRDYGFRARRLFDTRIAAQLLGEPGVGLAALLERHFGVRMSKKLQRADWSTRPLTADMIAYAAADTKYLTRLRDLLASRLDAAGRLPWAQEEFARLEDVRWTPPPAENGYLRLKGARALPPRTQLVLRALHAWREERARTLDRSPFRVLPNEALLAVARAMPRSTAELHAVTGLPGSLARRYGPDLLAAVHAGLDAPASALLKPDRVPRTRPDPAHEARFERLKQLRNRRAHQLGLEPGVACPNGALSAIARAAPTSVDALRNLEDLRRWQLEALGPAAIVAAAAEQQAQ